MENGNLWILLKQHDEQNEGVILLILGTLHCERIVFTTLTEGWPNLACQRSKTFGFIESQGFETIQVWTLQVFTVEDDWKMLKVACGWARHKFDESNEYRPSLTFPVRRMAWESWSLTKRASEWNSKKMLLFFANMETLRRFFVIEGTKSIWFQESTLGVREESKEKWPIREIDKPEPSPMCTLSSPVNSVLCWRL